MDADLLVASECGGLRQEWLNSARPNATTLVRVKFGSAHVPIYEGSVRGHARFTVSFYQNGRRVRRTFDTISTVRRRKQRTWHGRPARVSWAGCPSHFPPLWSPDCRNHIRRSHVAPRQPSQGVALGCLVCGPLAPSRAALRRRMRELPHTPHLPQDQTSIDAAEAEGVIERVADGHWTACVGDDVEVAGGIGGVAVEGGGG